MGIDSDILDNPGPVIANCIFGSPPIWHTWDLPRHMMRFLRNHYHGVSVILLWHPETRDHLAVVNGVTLQLPNTESEYPRFIGLDFSTYRAARKCYPRIKAVDLSGYRTIVEHDNGMGMRVHSSL